MACYATELCTGLSSALQCCRSSSVSLSNGVSITHGSNCTVWGATKCYPRSATKSCTDSACQATATVCSDPEYPECFTAVSYDDPRSKYTAMWCEVVSSSVLISANWLKSWSTSLPSDYSSTQPSGPVVQTPGSTVPFSTIQATVTASGESPGSGSVQATTSSNDASRNLCNQVAFVFALLAIFMSS